jgi:hypothetical protein
VLKLLHQAIDHAHHTHGFPKPLVRTNTDAHPTCGWFSARHAVLLSEIQKQAVKQCCSKLNVLTWDKTTGLPISTAITLKYLEECRQVAVY